MLVINKKIIRYILISIALGVSIFFIGKSKKTIIPVSSLPISDHTIVLDAGHGKPDRSELLVKMEYLKKK